MIRLAQEGDAPALAAILGDWVRDKAWMPVLHSAEEDLEFLRRLIAGTPVLVAERGAERVGFLALEGADIAQLQVRATDRGQGIGSALLNRAKADHAQLSLWVFQANTSAIRFYERHGFVPVEETDGVGNEEGLPDLRMQWRRP